MEPSKKGNERHWQSLDMSVSKTVLIEGDLSKKCGSFGAQLAIEFQEIPELDNTVQDSIYFNEANLKSKSITLTIGNAYNEFDLGIEQAFVSMYPGEQARFDLMTPNWKSVQFVATRTDSGENSSVFEWSDERQLQFAQDSYDQAVELIRAKNYLGALKLFRQASTLCFFMQNPNKDLQLKSLSNITLCQKSLDNLEHVVTGVDIILEQHPQAANAAKLIARRGQAQSKLQNYELAIKDFNESLSLDSGNKSVAQDLAQAKKGLRNADVKMSNAMKKMFG